MSTTRVVTHLTSVALLLLWGGVQLYFYVSGRVGSYLSSEGIFRPMVLASGIGLIVLGIFNLATMGSEEEGCCGHDHAHDDHDHSHDDCCGHDHSHQHGKDCDHDHSHQHSKDCGHHHHEHSDCCGHDHGHPEHHDHGHSHDHGHGILDESGPLGRTAAILILAVPLLIAAVMTPDGYSSFAMEKKGGMVNDYTDTSRANEFSLKKGAPTAAAANPAPAVTANGASRVPGSNASPAATVATSTLPPATIASTPPAPANATPLPAGSSPPAPAMQTAEMAKNGSPNAGKPTDAAKSFGSFTLADLKAQVPQSKEGNFILEVPELYYTAGDLEVQRVLAGQPIETKAQVVLEKNNNADGKRLRILRMLVQCCAADARPYSVPIEFKEKAPTFKDMTWVEVKGTMVYQKDGEQTVPVVQVTSIKETPAPDNAMLY